LTIRAWCARWTASVAWSRLTGTPADSVVVVEHGQRCTRWRPESRASLWIRQGKADRLVALDRSIVREIDRELRGRLASREVQRTAGRSEVGPGRRRPTAGRIRDRDAARGAARSPDSDRRGPAVLGPVVALS
jgi:hypothetical protein